MLPLNPFDSFEAIDQGSSKAIGCLCWQLKVLADMVFTSLQFVYLSLENLRNF